MKFDISRVYTAVNADELKAGDKVLVDDTVAGLRAQVEGKANAVVLQDIDHDGMKFRFTACHYHHLLAYLVERAAEKKWRAYKDCDEMIADYKRRAEMNDKDGIGLPRNPMWHPQIWVKRKDDDSMNLITYITEREVTVHGMVQNLDTLHNSFTYMDGSPCGIEE